MFRRKSILKEDELWYEVILDKATKIEHSRLDSDSDYKNWVLVIIKRKINKKWQRIGMINIMIKENSAHIGDIIIGEDEPFNDIGNLKIPNIGYKYRKYRGKGIGTKSIQYFIEYFRENGIKEIYGELSSRDDYEKVSNFWKKFDFKVVRFVDPKGTTIWKIYKKL